MKNLNYLLGLLFVFLFSNYLQAQGCVAIRGNSSCGANVNNTFNLQKGEFITQIGFRHFKSFRHFRGDVEETHRLEEGTEVINKSSFIDLSMSYGISDRFFGTVILPWVHHQRSSMYEHGGNPPGGLGERHSTSSQGLGDIRLSLGYWLFDPAQHNFNYSVGLGVKLPSGRSDYKDLFYNQGENKDEDVESVVDQSIQPGDGGTGFTVDIQGFHPITPRFGVGVNLFYLSNFYESNGVLTRSGRSEFSCPDQYAIRAEAFYNLWEGLSLSFGGRLEGVPAYDLIGGSAGYRRPGYAVSAEPGVTYARNRYFFFATVPVALYRNRIRSYEDKARTQSTGMYRHGDAAFADYLINVGLAIRLNAQPAKLVDL